MLRQQCSRWWATRLARGCLLRIATPPWVKLALGKFTGTFPTLHYQQGLSNPTAYYGDGIIYIPCSNVTVFHYGNYWGLGRITVIVVLGTHNNKIKRSHLSCFLLSVEDLWSSSAFVDQNKTLSFLSLFAVMFIQVLLGILLSPRTTRNWNMAVNPAIRICCLLCGDIVIKFDLLTFQFKL